MQNIFKKKYITNIKYIKLSYTKIDNQSFVIEYDFEFRKAFTSYSMKNMFIKRNLKKSRKLIKNFPTYEIKEMNKKSEFEGIYRIEEEYFLLMFQSYIARYFYTGKRRKYQLLIINCNSYNEKYISEEEMKDAFLTSVYYNMFIKIEIKKLNNIITKYFISARTRVKKKDYLWLINKIRCIEENDERYLKNRRS